MQKPAWTLAAAVLISVIVYDAALRADDIAVRRRILGRPNSFGFC